MPCLLCCVESYLLTRCDLIPARSLQTACGTWLSSAPTEPRPCVQLREAFPASISLPLRSLGAASRCTRSLWAAWCIALIRANPWGFRTQGSGLKGAQNWGTLWCNLAAGFSARDLLGG